MGGTGVGLELGESRGGGAAGPASPTWSSFSVPVKTSARDGASSLSPDHGTSLEPDGKTEAASGRS